MHHFLSDKSLVPTVLLVVEWSPSRPIHFARDPLRPKGHSSGSILTHLIFSSLSILIPFGLPLIHFLVPPEGSKICCNPSSISEECLSSSLTVFMSVFFMDKISVGLLVFSSINASNTAKDVLQASV